MGKVYITLTADWEGEDLSFKRNIYQLRNKIGKNIPITHFICPAYFLKIKNATKKIKESIHSSDEVALHIHPLKELINYCKIEFRSDHNFYRSNAGILPYNFRKRLPWKLRKLLTYNVSGRGVPLSVYSKEELRILMKVCIKLLQDNLDVDTIKGFRAGGNIANDKVIETIEDIGLTYDSSAFPPEILSHNFNVNSNGNLLDNHGDYNGLYTDYIAGLWGYNEVKNGFLQNTLLKKYNPEPSISINSQPFKIKSLWEFPINGGMSDFTTHKKTLKPLLNNLITKSKQSDRDYFLNLGFHMEGDVKYKNTIIEFFEEILPGGQKNIQFVTLNEVLNMHITEIGCGL